MSYDDTFDENDFYAPAEPLVTDDAPFDEGQGEVTDTGDEAPAEVTDTPQPNYFDPSTVADHLVKVKVDGEEIDVPVTELVQGYSRQADYTRKTQSLAEEREKIAFWQQVDQAMRVNPEMTLDYLSKTYGITPAQASAQVAAQQDDDWGYDDPIQRELRELRELVKPALEFTQVQQAERHLQQTVAGLSARYGEEFNPTEVIQEALNRGITDVGMLEFVFKDMAFDRYRARSAAVDTNQQMTAEENARRIAAAQTASTVIGQGSSARGTNATPPPRPVRTIRDAFRLAEAELGI